MLNRYVFDERKIQHRYKLKEFMDHYKNGGKIVDFVNIDPTFRFHRRDLDSWKEHFTGHGEPWVVTKENKRVMLLWKKEAPTCSKCGYPYFDENGKCKTCRKRRIDDRGHQLRA